MILRLAWAELRNRPGRALLLFAGYALGVAVMVVLLAVGEAMLEQSRDRALIGGGDVVVVPVGVSPEMLRSGGVSSMFLGVDHARFLHRRVLESPHARQAHGIVAASPLLDGAQMELFTRGRRFTGRASGEIPSRARLAGAAPDLLAGRWLDSRADRRWLSPSPAELRRELDHFHDPSGAAAGDSTWAEWHYFNLVLDEGRWVYVTLMVSGRVGTPGRWGGRILITTRDADGSHRSRARNLPGQAIRYDTLSPELAFGSDAGVSLEPDGGYRVRADAEGARIDLRVAPTAGLYFPSTDLGGAALVSGYVAPALHATASGTVCLPRCERVERATAYHDHNWGVWGGVSWEWGAASDSTLALLYGVVRGDSTGASGLFAYLTAPDGVRGVFRPGEIRILETAGQRTEGRRVGVPRRFRFEDPAGGLQVEVRVAAAHVTDLNRPRRRYFVQMRGIATVRLRGREVGRLPGFFETYVD
jgi:hypothetical protein